jgi:hypothetical protein
MPKHLLSILLLIVPPVFGQLDMHTLTITASRSIVLQPDQVVFALSVTSGVATSLDQVVSALSGVGVTAANLTGISNNPTPPTLQWNFTLSAPLSSLSATIASLAKLQQTIAQNNTGLSLTFTFEGSAVSQQLRQSQSCSDSDLVADATAQGQKLATAAGFTLGPVISFTNAPQVQPYGVNVVNGNFAVAEIYPNLLLGTLTTPVTCSLSVEFRLLP